MMMHEAEDDEIESQLDIIEEKDRLFQQQYFEKLALKTLEVDITYKCNQRQEEKRRIDEEKEQNV